MKSTSELEQAIGGTRLGAFVLALGAWSAMATPVRACDPAAPPSEYAIDGTSDDAEPPTLVDARVTIRRAENPGGPGPGDCSELGSYRVEVDASDDTTPREDLGYELRLVEGTLPFVLPTGVVADSSADGALSTWFADEGGGFAATIEVRVVDRAGNLSDATEVRVSDDETSGCATSPGARPHLGSALPLLAWLLLRRSSRSRSRVDGRAQSRNKR